MAQASQRGQDRGIELSKAAALIHLCGEHAGYTAPMVLAALGECIHRGAGAAAALTGGTALCLWVSAAVCALHIPETWSPGRFDVFGSHAIMHVLVTVEYVLEWMFIREGMLAEVSARIHV